MTLTEEQREAIRVISKLPMAIGCQLCHPYIMKNYGSHFIVLRAMIDSSEHFTDHTKMIGFDLEAARAGIAHYRIENPSNVDTESPLKELVDQANLAEDALAEIERLRASLIDLHAEYINTLEKNPGCSAWDLDEQSDADQRRLRKNAAHAISIVEPPIYLQAGQQATLIKSLKKEIRRLKHESKVEQEFTNSYIKRLHDAEARIKELEDAHKRSGAKYAKIINELRSSVYANIPGLDVGKIGPDAAKPQSWQITEERIGLLEYCLETLLDAPDIEEIPGPGHSIEMLRAMLKEAE